LKNRLDEKGNVSYSSNKNQPTMVILRALALGDFLTGLPALRALAQAFPEHHRILTCPSWLRPLARMTGVVDELIDGAYFGEESGNAGLYKVPTDLQERIALEKSQLNGLRAPKEPDIAVNLRGQRIALHEALLQLKPHRLIGFYNPDVPETIGSPIWRSDEYEVVRWCRLLQENGIPADPHDLHIASPDCDVPENIRGGTIIHPGAGSPARCWPVERWAAVARWETRRGKKVILTGSSHEIDLAAKVSACAELPPESILAGRTDILKFSALVAAAGKVICTNTGIAHLAVAFRTPSIVLFGPEPPGRFGPPPHLPIHRTLWVGTKGDTYGNSPDPGLMKLQVEDVIAEVLSLERMCSDRQVK
jgi:ADP-heptose:LPS heptosyltransferase